MIDVLSSLLRELNRDQTVPERGRPVNSLPELREALTDMASGLLGAVCGSDYLDLTRVIIADSPRVPEIGQLWAQTITGTIRPVVTDQLEQARRSGVIRIDDIDAATRLFVGGLLTYILPGERRTDS
ncbi:TetR/AcrR family transcriptional regulator C-terminal domain-containing protein [Phytoactinopolyspora endophytica]|uniref:TetR/AcrR family transcriptional regulator C-terminal domain-containing protein n=1 Tax=Phytoactinopolyspora endophytica TaxID=1642495 RepID=UPI0013EDE32F|nr:TetR/AcrR family transcriptional regulator C-terminal domain-containing protein [Phytoactinopolyspora endophytica]